MPPTTGGSTSGSSTSERSSPWPRELGAGEHDGHRDADHDAGEGARWPTYAG